MKHVKIRDETKCESRSSRRPATAASSRSSKLTRHDWVSIYQMTGLQLTLEIQWGSMLEKRHLQYTVSTTNQLPIQLLAKRT